jgi:adenylate cyclase
MPAPRRLTVMVSLDVTGFTRLVQQDERATLAGIAAIRRDLIDTTLQHRNGHIFKTMGDGALIEFPNVEDAVSWTVISGSNVGPEPAVPGKADLG